LNPYAIDVRYPGEPINLSEARDAIAAMIKSARLFARGLD
jgi:hypothetical protein